MAAPKAAEEPRPEPIGISELISILTIVPTIFCPSATKSLKIYFNSLTSLLSASFYSLKSL